jgi:exopolysaccharide biosynthesis protein
MRISSPKASAVKAARLATAVAVVGNVLLSSLLPLGASAMGVLGPQAVRLHAMPRARAVSRRAATSPRYSSRYTMLSTLRRGSKKHGANLKGGKTAKKAPAPVAAKPIQPQQWADELTSETIAPGVVHRYFRGPLNIHVIDIDMMRAPVKVQPSLAGNSFDRLKDVVDHARDTRAIAAVNANYFKTNGTPLGTLIIDGEWVAGPLYDRVSLGITRNGYVRIDRVNLSGTLTTSNEEVPTIWVNNVNQPRRTGCHLFAYTRRWGSFVRLPYQGALVAINAQGEVMDTADKEMGIPWGGYVLADSKDSPISHLVRGDKVQMVWHTKPSEWADVVEAVSGGPMLIKNGELYLDLKDENFRRNWTGSQIHARTAAGVTANNHLLLTTIEGPHTLWDFAKFLYKLGAVEAMNLDGGGSTTMVVNGVTVTRNANTKQRRVASSIVVLDQRNLPQVSQTVKTSPANVEAKPAADEQQPASEENQMQHQSTLDTPAGVADAQRPLDTSVKQTGSSELKEPQAMTDAPASAVEVKGMSHTVSSPTDSIGNDEPTWQETQRAELDSGKKHRSFFKFLH